MSPRYEVAPVSSQHFIIGGVQPWKAWLQCKMGDRFQSTAERPSIGHTTYRKRFVTLILMVTTTSM